MVTALGSIGRPELVFRLSIVVLVGVTAAVGSMPAIHGHGVAPAVDLVLDTVAALVSLSLTVLMWARFRERRDPIAMYQAAGFLSLTVAYLTAVWVSLGDGNPATLSEPQTNQLYVFALARLLAAAIVVIGGTAALARAQPRHPLWVVAGPAIVVGALAVVGYQVIDIAAAIPALAIVIPDVDGSSLPVIAPFGVIVQLASACLFLGAALVLRRHARRSRSIGDSYIAVGLLFAGFAEIHWAMYPVGHPGQVSTADLLRLAFFVSLLLAVESEARSTLANLRMANAELAELREVDVERASLEERARLARELHDGLAQDLWLAKLRAGQLASVPGLPPAATDLIAETNAAIDAGLAEARQAVMALRLVSDSSDSFGELMLRYIDDFQDRFGIRVEFTCAGDTSGMAPRTQAEVLRIAQEALVNARQHSAGNVVGVCLEIHDGQISLRVADNGRGFDVSAARRASYGIHAMRERAQLIGGRLWIHSKPGDGTTVFLSAPVQFSPTAVGGTT